MASQVMVHKGYGSKPAKFPKGSLGCGLKKSSTVARPPAHTYVASNTPALAPLSCTPVEASQRVNCCALRE